LALIHFGITLFVSAFILFLVQPLIGKFVLPKLGGTPQVWNTCMVFFQMVLLLGYGYTHFVSTKLKPRAQVILHSVVILLPFVIFMVRPFWFIRDWTPPLGSNPIFATLFLLATVVGIPFFVVSTTAPLLQKWFGFTGHEAAKDPYFLYGASNFGSMLSLLIYPVAIEPFSVLNTQAIIWMGSYAILAALVFAAVAMVWKQTGQAGASKIENERPEISTMPVSGEVLAGAIQNKPNAPKPSLALDTPSNVQVENVDIWRRLRWVALAAVPSSLMLGVTSHITTDLSPIPLFWLIPLAIYLASFILVFARWPMVWVEAPHTVMVLLQPIGVALMVLFDMVHLDTVWPAIVFNIIGFTLTTMVCHGELAKDRPSTKYLTDFYLMMSVGGMVGGMLNALIAPLFPVVFEFNLAIIAACLLRPNLSYGNWLDSIFSGFAEKTPDVKLKGKGAKAPSIARSEPGQGLSYGLDIAVGLGVFVIAFMVNIMFSARSASRETLIIAYFVVFILALTFFARGLRFGLAMAGIIFAYEIYTFSQESDSVLYRARSYFGVIRVKQSGEVTENANKEKEAHKFTTLIHGHINHGMNYVKNPDDPTRDFSRLATTYYHRKGPAGIVMEKFNWFKDGSSNNTFWADTRMPAGMVAQGSFGALGTGILPFGQLIEVWTEPPFATIGLGTGTMASYGRPFQHVHFYEIDDQIRRLSLPEKGRGKAYFTYLQDAKDRGANVQVLMGDARQRMNLPYGNYDEAQVTAPKLPVGGPENFYHMMVVDAFSSDAIPAHLLTEEAFKMYFKHLTPDGILCVHTSNRFVDLPRVVADVAEKCDLVALRGHDSAPGSENNSTRDKGHFTSEWVMVARKAPKDPANPQVTERYNLKDLKEPTGYREAMRKAGRPAESYWQIPSTHNGKYLWTDDYYNLLNILRIFVGGRDD
jgi:hypothetical protein